MRFNLPVRWGVCYFQLFSSGKLLCFIFLICSTFFILNTTAQTSTIDSLKKVLPQLRGTARINCLNELGFEYSNPYWSESKYIQTDTALLYTIQALNESQQLNYAPGIGKAYQNIGMVHEQHGNYILSETYTGRAIPILYSQHMQNEFHRARINYGWCKCNRGNYDEAIEIFKKELVYYNQIKDTIHIAMINRMIGRVYDIQGYSDMAFNYFEVDLKIKKYPNDTYGTLRSPVYKANIYLAAGDTSNAILNYRIAAQYVDKQHLKPDYLNTTTFQIYRLQKKFDSALLYLNQSDLISQSKHTDSLFRKVTLMENCFNLSTLYLDLKNYDSAIFFGAKYLKDFTRNGNSIMVMSSLKNIATAYFNKANNPKSLYFANQLLNYSQHVGARPFTRDASLLLAKIYESRQQLGRAYNWFKKYSALNTVLEKDNFSAKMYAWDAISKMNDEEKQYRTQIKMNEAKNKAAISLLTRDKKLQLYVFISAILITMLVMTIIIRSILLRRKQDRLQHLFTESQLLVEKQHQEKEVMQLHQQKSDLEMQALRAQMNPHFIFNSLNAINMFILEKDKLQASAYLSKFSKLIRFILQNSQEAFIPLENELAALKLYLDLELLRFDKRFEYKIILDDGLDTAMLKVPPLIIQPYAENAIWHGLMHKNERGHLTIELYIKDEMLYYEITDDGIGRKEAAAIKSKSAAKHKSMGIRITTDRLLMLQQQHEKENSISVTDLTLADGSAGGTAVQIKIPARYD
ncbi:MAG: hypothetical protein GC171_17110 [Terrimonas sp.]|nr:hypothetical protein [Terrimonas sp.]